MTYKTRRCLHCDKGGAYSWNNLCAYHWDQLIDKNIKKFVAEDRKKKP